MYRSRRQLVVLCISLGGAVLRADEPLFMYEGNTTPAEAGWEVSQCEPPCTFSVEGGYLILRWEDGVRFSGFLHRFGSVESPAPSPPFWFEWRFASNYPLQSNPTCDGGFVIQYMEFGTLLFMFGDSVISFSLDDALLHLPFEARTFRLETVDGSAYSIFVDGDLFTDGTVTGGNGVALIQIDGWGGCDLDLLPTVNTWDFVRYGTISYGEQIVESNPPNGLVDARTHAPLDRFTVRYEKPNFALVDEIVVETTGGVVPVVTKTRRLDNGPPDVVEIVLDRPIPFGETTAFTFDDGVATNVVEYTFAPGDTDGDGDADLRDASVFQNCFGAAELIGPCHALDSTADSTIDLADYDEFTTHLLGPGWLADGPLFSVIESGRPRSS